MGYIGENISNMEYAYGGGPSNFPFWKLSNGNFPRGEAPPPYEEAIASPQMTADSLNSQCTVSVATTHRSLPVGINLLDISNDVHRNQREQNIATNTTNLINININGTELSSVLAAETHQPTYSFIPNDNRSTRNHELQTQPKITAVLNSDEFNSKLTPLSQSNFNIVNNANCSQPIDLVGKVQSHTSYDVQQNRIHKNYMQMEKCAHKNCHLNISTRYNQNAEVQSNTSCRSLFENSCHQSTIKYSRKSVPNGANSSGHSCGNQVISIISTEANDVTLISNGSSKSHNSSKNHHRTIPRHFAVIDSIVENSSNPKQTSDILQISTTKEKKKPICHCPVTHIPIAYSSSSKPSNSQKLEPLAGPQAMFDNETSCNVLYMPCSLYQAESNPLREFCSNSNCDTLKRSARSHVSNSHQKLRTSKNVPDPKARDHRMHVCSKISFHKLPDKEGEHNNNIAQQVQFPELSAKCNLNTPKIPKAKSSSKCMLSVQKPTTKIQTISKSNDIVPKSDSTVWHQTIQKDYCQRLTDEQAIMLNYNTKSLNRKDERNSGLCLTLPSHDPTENKSQSIGKINSTTFYPTQNNYVTYTLPKHSGKMSLNSTIAKVVSKVPSVITIPASVNQYQPNQENIIAEKSHLLDKNNIFAPSNILQNTYVGNECQRMHNDLISAKSDSILMSKIKDKPLPVCTTSKNCSNPQQHFLPNDTSLDDDYLSECENCKTAHSSKYYLSEDISEPQETMTLQRKMDDKEEEQIYYRASHTLPTNSKKSSGIANNREPWFSSIPASSSSDEEVIG